MAGERRVSVRVQHRELVDDLVTGEARAYPGVRLAYYVRGRWVAEVWVPVGNRASVVDDDLLIDVLRRAVHWNEFTDWPPLPDLCDAMPPSVT